MPLPTLDRRALIAGTAATIAAPAIVRAQPATLKVAMILPRSGFLAQAGQRLLSRCARGAESARGPRLQTRDRAYRHGIERRCRAHAIREGDQRRCEGPDRLPSSPARRSQWRRWPNSAACRLSSTSPPRRRSRSRATSSRCGTFRPRPRSSRKASSSSARSPRVRSKTTRPPSICMPTIRSAHRCAARWTIFSPS